MKNTFARFSNNKLFNGWRLLLLALMMLMAAWLLLVVALTMRAKIAVQMVERGHSLDEQIGLLAGVDGMMFVKPEYDLLLADKYLMRAESEYANDKMVAMNDFQSAFSATRRATIRGRSEATILEQAGMIYERLSLIDPTALTFAETVYRQASALDEQNPQPHWRLGLVLEAAGNILQTPEDRARLFDSSLTEFAMAIDLQNNFAPAYFAKAKILDTLGQYDEAVEAARKASQLSNDPQYAFELGRLLYNRGASRKGQLIARNNSASGLTIGYKYQADKKLALLKPNDDLLKAEKIFSELTATNAAYTDALYGLVVLESRLGNTERAKKYLEYLTKALPDSRQKADLADNFKYLK